jgi:AraC-like DNA-binding protein
MLKRREDTVAVNLLAQLAADIERHTTSDGIKETEVPGLALYRSSSISEHDATVYEPCLCIVAQGSKEVSVGGETFRYDALHSLLVSVDLPATSRVIEASPQRPCLVVRIALDLAVVGELLADKTASPSSPSSRGLATASIDPPTLDAVVRLVALLDSPHDVAVLAPLVNREIVYRVLTGPHGARLRQIASTGGPAYRIASAIRWLKEHYSDPLRIESLARRVRMSPSAFHLHFRGVTAMSPLQYQKQLRLQEARRLMLGEGLDATRAAFRVGYESPSQFSREYRRMFGSPPRQNVSALQVGRQNETEPHIGHRRPFSSSKSVRRQENMAGRRS